MISLSAVNGSTAMPERKATRPIGGRKKDREILQIEYSKEAVKHINQLDKQKKQRIKNAIEKLPAGDIRKLVGFKTDYRLRVGDYRVLFSRESDIIIVKDVLPRGEAYKRL